MVKPQLIEYIEQQLEQGFSFDAIGDALLSQGLAPEEIQEAFAVFEYIEGEESTEYESTETMTLFKRVLETLGLPTGKLATTVILILLGIITIIVLIILSFVLTPSNSGTSLNQQSVNNPLSIKSTTTDSFAKDNVDTVTEFESGTYQQNDNNNNTYNQTITNSAETEKETEVNDGNCSTDFDCFIKASQNCSDATARIISEKLVFGGMVLSDISYEMAKSSDGGCIFTTVINKTSLTSDEPLFGKESVCVYADYSTFTSYLESIKGGGVLSVHDSNKGMAELQAEISGASYCYGPFFDELEAQLSF